MDETRARAERECLGGLSAIELALERMRGQLPDDARPLETQARDQVQLWQARLARGDADLAALGQAMRELKTTLDALAARLVLHPWAPGPSGTRNAKN